MDAGVSQEQLAEDTFNDPNATAGFAPPPIRAPPTPHEWAEAALDVARTGVGYEGMAPHTAAEAGVGFNSVIAAKLLARCIDPGFIKGGRSS